jgi:CRP/FNR family transcriptional regulator, cyclic AMP receptor protein
MPIDNRVGPGERRGAMPTVLELCESLPLRSFAAGETVMAEGATDSLLYILVEGAVEIVKSDVQINTVAEPGAFFGEVSVLLGMPHMATVRALRPCAFRVADDPPAFFRTNPPIALAVAAVLARRLHTVTTYLIDLKRQFESHDSHLSLVDEVLESLIHHQEPQAEPGSDRHPDPTVE